MATLSDEEEGREAGAASREADEAATTALEELGATEVWDSYTAKNLELALDEVAAAFVCLIKLTPKWEKDESLESDFFRWLDQLHNGKEKLAPIVDDILELAAKGRYGEELEDEELERADDLRTKVCEALAHAKESRPWNS